MGANRDNGGNGGDADMAENDVAAQAASARQYDWRPRPDPTVLTTMQLRETETALNRTITEKLAGLRELLESRLDGMDRATELLAEQITKIPDDSLHGRDVLRHEFTTVAHNLRELIESRLGAMDKATELLAATVGRVPSDTDKATEALRTLIEARIDAMDKANELLAENVRQFPSDLDKATKALREVLQGEIRNVQDVAQEKFTAIEGTFASNALALTAALAAQKEAAAEQNKSNTLAITKSEQATKETIASNAAQFSNSLQSQAATIGDLKDRVVRIEAGGLSRTDQRTEQRSDDTYLQMERSLAENRTRAAITAGISIIAVIVSVIVAIVLIVHH